MITAAMKDKISAVAKKLEISDPQWLEKLIRFESGFNPSAKNPVSSARGLIQVMDETAQKVFGAASSEALIKKYPDFNSQMDKVVYPYLKQWAPYRTKQSLYMAVFFPVARTVDPQTTFIQLYQKYFTNWQILYPKFVKSNPFIEKVQDYIDKVDGTFVKRAVNILPLALLAATVFYLLRRYRPWPT